MTSYFIATGCIYQTNSCPFDAKHRIPRKGLLTDLP
ncbi:hypothetical protein DBR47_22455 [Paucibacter sp. KBW04]|nr:hypothetical protein DBR47_22455 [Paucibacter sp. KBW04]